MSQNQPYPSVKPEPHSTDVFADHGPLFSEAEMTDMTERAWAIKKAREQEKWHLGDIRPKGPQTNKAAIGDTARSNATSRRSLLGSLYGLDLKARKLSQNLSANRDSKNNVYVKYEVGNKNPLDSKESPVTATTSLSTVSTGELPKVRVAPYEKTLLVGWEQQLKAVDPKNLGLPRRTRYYIQLVAAGTLGRNYPWPTLYHPPCFRRPSRHFPGRVLYAPLPIQSRGLYLYGFSQSTSDILHFDETCRYQNIGPSYRNYSNNTYQASGGSESFAFGLGTLSTNFSRTQGPGSEGYRHTSQPEILTHEDMVLRLRELAYELGYGIFPLKAQHELGTPSVAPFSLFPSPSSQLPPPLPDCPFHWPPPAPIPLQPDISAPSNA